MLLQVLRHLRDLRLSRKAAHREEISGGGRLYVFSGTVATSLDSSRPLGHWRATDRKPEGPLALSVSMNIVRNREKDKQEYPHRPPQSRLKECHTSSSGPMPGIALDD